MTKPKKCSRDDCPTANINVNSNAQCHACKAKFHLPCFNVTTPAAKLFVIKNIVFLCDECLSTGEKSPKRKGNDVQKTLRQTLLTPSRFSSPQTSSDQTEKSTIDQLQQLVHNLSDKIDVNTNTVASLKESVVSMHETVSSNQAQIDESLKKNDTEFSSAAKTIVEQLEKIEQKQSYAQALGSSSSNQIVRQVTDNSQQSTAISKPAPKKAVAYKFKGIPLNSGTNEDTTHMLGAPVVFTERRRHRQNSTNAVPARPKFTKSVYITRLQPSVTVDGLKLFLHTQIKDLDESQMSIRMLVKKDQDMSEMSFISFSISCTDNLFSQLGSPSFWPSHIKMREFINEPRKPRETAGNKTFAIGVSSAATSEMDSVDNNGLVTPSKNEDAPPAQPLPNVEVVSMEQSQ